MTQFTAYQCDFCGKIFKRKEPVERHEIACSYNPICEQCDTCANLGYEYGNDFCKIWNEEPTYDYYDERLKCPFWVDTKKDKQ